MDRTCTRGSIDRFARWCHRVCRRVRPTLSCSQRTLETRSPTRTSRSIDPDRLMCWVRRNCEMFTFGHVGPYTLNYFRISWDNICYVKHFYYIIDGCIIWVNWVLFFVRVLCVCNCMVIVWNIQFRTIVSSQYCSVVSNPDYWKTI